MSTSLRLASGTTCSWLLTLLAPSIPLATSVAAVLACSVSTLPLRVTVPLLVSTSVAKPLVRLSAIKASLVFAVTQASLTPEVRAAFAFALLLAFALALRLALLAFSARSQATTNITRTMLAMTKSCFIISFSFDCYRL